MAQATFSVRMDEDLKRQFDQLCKDFGMNASTAINVFARAVVLQRRIPFEIASSDCRSTSEQALQAFLGLRGEARRNNVSGMTLEEINEEIRASRAAAGDADDIG